MAIRSRMRVFDYPDVRLLPKKCVVKSRSEVDTSVKLGNKSFNLPIVPANMSTIIDENLAIWLADNGYFYVMHRFDVNPVSFTQRMHERGLFSSISLGIKEVDKSFVRELSQKRIIPDFITIDVAHGHSDMVIEMIDFIKTFLPDTFVIAGNVGTVEGALDLENAGADGIKVGIGPGMACLTSPNTGFGTRNHQLSTIEAVSEALQSALVIADGGIREFGDIAKSIALGADFVMIGGMLSGHDENPGDIIENEKGEKFKVFFGSASEHQKGEIKHVEGKKILMPYKGSIKDTMRTIQEHLQSSVSYAGGKEMLDLRNVEYVFV